MDGTENVFKNYRFYPRHLPSNILQTCFESCNLLAGSQPQCSETETYSDLV